MSPSRDSDRLIHAFLREGEELLQDQVYDAVRAEIETKRQRVVIGPWRMPSMNRFVIFGLGGAAAVVAILLLGSRLLGTPTSNVGGPGVEPTPTPEASEVEPSSTPEGLLPEGYHVLWEAPPISVSIPAPDWYGEPGDGILIKNDDPDAPVGAGMIVFAGDDLYVYGDPCQWSTTRPDEPANTVDELVAALVTQPSRNASGPVDVTVDGYAGKSVTVHVPDDAVFGDCDAGEFRTLVLGVTGARFHQDPGQIDELWIVDVNGEVVVIDTAYYEGTPPDDVAELRAIVNSITFEAP